MAPGALTARLTSHDAGSPSAWAARRDARALRIRALHLQCTYAQSESESESECLGLVWSSGSGSSSTGVLLLWVFRARLQLPIDCIPCLHRSRRALEHPTMLLSGQTSHRRPTPTVNAPLQRKLRAGPFVRLYHLSPPIASPSRSRLPARKIRHTVPRTRAPFKFARFALAGGRALLTGDR